MPNVPYLTEEYDPFTKKKKNPVYDTKEILTVRIQILRV